MGDIGAGVGVWVCVCVKAALSLILEELWDLGGICGIPDWNWPGYGWISPLRGQEDLNLEMLPHSSILAWRTP